MEAKPNMIKKYNKPAFGLILGIIIPILSFFIYYLYSTFGTNIGFDDFFQSLLIMNSFTPIISLCVLPNLILYFIYKKMDYWYAIKGVVISVFIYTLIVVILKFS